MAIFVSKPCPVCEAYSTLVIPVGALMDIRLGVPVDRAWPEATEEQARIVRDGMHADCAEELFGEPDCG